MKHKGDRCVVERDTPLVWLMCRRTAHIHNSVTRECVAIISARLSWGTGRLYTLFTGRDGRWTWVLVRCEIVAPFVDIQYLFPITYNRHSLPTRKSSLIAGHTSYYFYYSCLRNLTAFVLFLSSTLSKYLRFTRARLKCLRFTRARENLCRDQNNDDSDH
ncbi:hypothetical protein E2C01_016821 [Portunus trituberculatus]|uniref:Uncharacterized protein n=1 Tax=Portunus trituberculatus TaxID=210409 RepID=A0A5B7DQJ9_PORTR|nr:hypothetical protein [Portunus trituberculatus]